MTELVAGGSGEVLTPNAEEYVEQMLAIPEHIFGAAFGPAQLDDLILEISDTLMHVGRAVTLLYEKQHAAEEEYQGKFADFMVMHEKSGALLARQFAMAKTKNERHALNQAKERLRYATEMQESLKNRAYGLMNIGKRMQPAYTAGRM
jgi:hypothetical protein